MISISRLRVFINIFLLLSAVLAAMSARAEQTILILGDSLSAAYGIEQNQGWVELLRHRLRANEYSYSVVNSSISGETTAGAVRRIEQEFTLFAPDILIIELGGNDGMRGLPIEQIYENLVGIVKYAKRQRTRTLLVGMRLPANYGAYGTAFYDVYRRVANDYSIALVPFFLAGLEKDRRWFLADGIHPTAAAQPLLLDNVWDSLAELLP